MLNTRYYVSERYYVAFLLGYDLLHDAFDKCDSPEGDTTFDRCLRIADSFLNSEYNTTLLGLYECVENYLRYSREFKIFEERFFGKLKFKFTKENVKTENKKSVVKKEIYLYNDSTCEMETLDVTDYLGDRKTINIEEVCQLALKQGVGTVISEEGYGCLVDEFESDIVGVSEEDYDESMDEFVNQWCGCLIPEFCYLCVTDMSTNGNVVIQN